MASLLDNFNDPAKILLIGKSGAGKTGSLASLVAAGYKVRILDTDKGVKTLRSLLLDPRYPYNKIIKARNIDITEAVNYISVDIHMQLKVVERRMGNTVQRDKLLGPKDAHAWDKAIEKLERWKDDRVDYGHVSTWGPDCVLVIDSFSTLAKCAYYFSQSLNNRLGARDEGYDYQRDIGAAQAQLTRLLEFLYDSSIGCNVIIISHITWVDESRGVANAPKRGGDNQSNDESFNSMVMPDGYPSAIGRALSPHMGKYFNDVYIVTNSGSGSNVRREISTVPTAGVIAKNSVFLERTYDITTGMARIFAALRGEPDPTDLVQALKPQASAAAAASPAPSVKPAPAPAAKPAPAPAPVPSPKPPVASATPTTYRK